MVCFQGLDNNPVVTTLHNLLVKKIVKCVMVRIHNKFYGAVAGDRKNLVINIQTKEGNTNLDT